MKVFDLKLEPSFVFKEQLEFSTHFVFEGPALNMVINLLQYFDLQHLNQHTIRLQKPFEFQADLCFLYPVRQTTIIMQKLEELGIRDSLVNL